MIEILGKYYKFNLEKICEFAKAKQEITEREILDNYDLTEDTKIVAKTIRELQNPGETYDALRYDLIKTVLIQVIAYDNEETIRESQLIPFGMAICLNTLLDEGIITEAKNNNRK